MGANREEGEAPVVGEGENGHSGRVNPLPSGGESFPGLLRGFSEGLHRTCAPQPQPRPQFAANALIN